MGQDKQRRPGYPWPCEQPLDPTMAGCKEMIIANPAVEGMGITLTALHRLDGHAATCDIGNSRGYLLREGLSRRRRPRPGPR